METVFLHYPNLTLDTRSQATVVAIGMFDGLHLGHTAVIREAQRLAQEKGLPCAVFTFVDHPRTVLRPDQPIPLLTNWGEKQGLLQQMGVDILIGAHFTEAFSELGPDEFLRRIIVDQLHAEHVVVGYNFAFGHRQSGTVETLRQRGPELGFGVTVVPSYQLDGQPVSSSRIRELLATGQIESANHLLGRPYSLCGPVVAGDQRGRLLGFPTANLQVEEHKLLPAYGVYAGHAVWTWASRDGHVPRESREQNHPCVINLGMRPTFDPPQLRVEAHLLDFNGDLYGEHMTLHLEHRLRAEKAFKSVDELVTQIRSDASRARELLPDALRVPQT